MTAEERHTKTIEAEFCIEKRIIHRYKLIIDGLIISMRQHEEINDKDLIYKILFADLLELRNEYNFLRQEFEKMEISEIKEYSQTKFEGYKYRGIFKFNLNNNRFRSIDIYTTDGDYNNVLKVLNKRKKEQVVSIELYHWSSKEQDEIDTAQLSEFLVDF